MLACLRVRRRIGAYLDGALDARASLATASHLHCCARCHAEAEALRRLHGALEAALAPPPAVEWTEFWAGVRRGIEQAGTPGRAPARWGAGWTLRPGLALGGVLAAALAGVAIWGAWPGPTSTEAPVVVSSASTDHPAATVMVYAPPERDLAVVWVFDLE